MTQFIDDFVAHRFDLVILIDQHVQQRMAERAITYDEIETTFLKGRVEPSRCLEYKNRTYNNVVLVYYFGRERGSVRIVVLTDGLRARVTTVYPRIKGRR